jgi:hypothetical protein
MVELPEITKAWMAGFFDGEGSIIIERRNPRPSQGNPSPRYILRACATNTVYSALEPFKMYFGGQLIKTKLGTNRPLYLWVSSSRLAMKFLETMLPYFRIKQKQAELGIFFQKKLRHQGGNAPLPQIYLAERERIRQAIQELNEGWPTPTIIAVDSQVKQLPLIAGDGLFNQKGQRVAGDTEESIYAALGLPYKEPWERD